jgi:FtsP/CotA-like multicopper oxidase with cupredoxin domain
VTVLGSRAHCAPARRAGALRADQRHDDGTPIHLHGLWSELENGHGEYRPYKHTINVKPGEKLSCLVSADTPGRWAYHCHLLYHMEMGMFREVRVP